MDLFQNLINDGSSEQVSRTVNIVLVAGLVYHLLFAVLFLWLAFMLRKRRNWVRVIVTAVVVFGSVGTLYSFSSPTPTPVLYKTLNIISWLLALANVGLLWLPERSRAYFRQG